MINSPFQESGVVGKWILYYDWGYKESPSKSELYFKDDGTYFIDRNYKGSWVQNGDYINFKPDTGPAVYDGIIKADAMTGTMRGTDESGCWSASKVSS